MLFSEQAGKGKPDGTTTTGLTAMAASLGRARCSPAACTAHQHETRAGRAGAFLLFRVPGTRDCSDVQRHPQFKRSYKAADLSAARSTNCWGH